MEKYIVGGFVRDKILGIPSNDIDYVVVGETEESMLAKGFKKVGADFDVFLCPLTGDEYALVGIDEKTGVGYTGFVRNTKNVSLIQDLGRRDLTGNAIAMTEDGEFVDPFNGIEDLKNKILRHTTEAFADDSLRVLRLARFTARFVDFTIADETKELAKSLRHELKYLTKERVFKELEKALKSEKPSNYFRSLLELDALDIVHPEIFAMVNVYQRHDYHAEGCVFEHTMRVLDEICLLTDNSVIRYAALYHEIGKPSTSNGEGNFYGYEDEELVLQEIKKLKERKHPNEYTKLAHKVVVWHTFVHQYSKMNTKKWVRRMTEKSFPTDEEEFEKLLFVATADEKGRVLGNRILSFDEVEMIFNGNSIDGFERRDAPDYSELRNIFKAVKKKVELPEEVIAKGVHSIKEYIYREQIKRAANANK